jgi:hypothetical protein
MGVLLGRPAGTHVMATRVLTVEPTGAPLRGPAMSLDMRPWADFEETAGLDGSEPLAVGLSGSLGFCRTTSAAPQPRMSSRPRGTRDDGNQ